MGKYAVLLLPVILIGVIRPLGASEISPGSLKQEINQPEYSTTYTIVSQDSVLAQNRPILDDYSSGSQESKDIKPQKVIEILVTAYSSSPEETDETPFITAAGTYVRHGVAAANFLPLGTRIRLPELFGEQIFIIEDRLNKRYNDRIDIWVPTKEQAIRLGQQLAEVEIL
jgi:3D (Asp-Asp-Asp) domain-containing protein